MGALYDNLPAYASKYLWVGVALNVVGVVCVSLALLGGARRQRPLKLWLAAAWAWLAGSWLVGTLALSQNIPKGPRVLAAAWGIVFALLGVLAFIDGVRNGQLVVAFLPRASWERAAFVLLLGLAFIYPLYMLAWGHRHPGLMLVGVGPLPTFIVSATLAAAALPKGSRLVATVLFLAVAHPLLGALRGMTENLVLLAPSAYAAWKLVTTRLEPGQAGGSDAVHHARVK